MRSLIVREAEPRLDVLRVLRPPRLLGRLEHGALRERVPDQVVPRPEVERQAVRDLPVVLRPRAVLPHVQRSQEIRRVRHADLVARRDRRERRQVPRVGVIPDGEERFDVRRHGPVLRGDPAHAVVAVARVVQGVQVLAAHLQIVMASRAVRDGEVVVERIHVLVAIPRQVRVARDRETAERDLRRARGDAVGRVPVVRPFHQRVLEEAVRHIPRPDLVQRAVAEDIGQRADDVGVVLDIGHRPGGMSRGARAERLDQARVRDLAHHAHLRRQLLIEDARELHGPGAGQRDVERRVRRVPDRRERLVLVFDVAEEVRLVVHDRAAQRPADLCSLNGIAWQHRIFARCTGCCGSCRRGLPRTCSCPTS